VTGNERGTADDTMIADGTRRRTAARGTHAPRFVQRYRALHLTWRAVIFFIGVAIVVGGIAMLVLPGPGWVAIIVGFSVLATEFVWAQRMLDWAKRQASKATQQALDPKVRRRNLILLTAGLILLGVGVTVYVQIYGFALPG
jgi:uncharacterized protein (TIGR02611 family)